MAEKTYAVARTTADLVDHTENGPRIGRRDSQLLFGESFTAQREDGEWIFGTSDVDGYEGYIYKTHLEPLKQKPTHIVASLGTHIYPEADFKTRPLMPLAFMSRVVVKGGDTKGFAEIADMGFVPANHLIPISELGREKDIASTAERFLHVPYLYGGRTGLGLDCSALVQLSVLYAGRSCPRDSDQQMAIGTPADTQALQRGDMVFFKGHVGMMSDNANIINATARTMDTRIEPLADLIRYYGPITAARRL